MTTRKPPGKNAKPKAKRATKSKPAPTVRMKSAEGIDAETITEEPAKPSSGRPSAYKPEFAVQAFKLCEAGFTDQQLADFFEVAKQTIYNWQVDHPEFLDSIKLGKDSPDDRTERSLYHRANGYEWYEEQTVKLKDIEYDDGRKVKETERVEIVNVLKRLPPDPTSMIFWLKNRRKEEWRDKQDHELTGKDGQRLIPDSASARDIAMSVYAMLTQGRVEDLPASDELREIEASVEDAAEPADEPDVLTFDPESCELVE